MVEHKNNQNRINHHNHASRQTTHASHRDNGRNTTSFAFINLQVWSNNHNASFTRNSSKVLLALCLTFIVAMVATSGKRKIKISAKTN